jgi:putative sterol carrier protein
VRAGPPGVRRRNVRVATVEECRVALAELAARLAAVDPQTKARHTADRSLSLRLNDLGCAFRGRISDGTLLDVVAEDGEAKTAEGKAQIRLQCSSDDLLALTRGELGAGSAWATGRLRVEASPLDLLRLRSLL